MNDILAGLALLAIFLSFILWSLILCGIQNI